MSEERKPYREPARSFHDGTWEAHYVAGQRLAIVLNDETGDGKTVTSIPLTPLRARMLVGLLHNMLTEAREPSGVSPSGQQLDGSWVLYCGETWPDANEIGFKPSKTDEG